jgi:glutathione synthase/RimK-type ligase-like ATP-grasp enzyme
MSRSPFPPEIALITSARMPKPDQDTGLLVDELTRLGVRAAVLAWDEPIDWAVVPLVVLRTPWDYVSRYTEFLQWVERVGGQTKLLNPPEVVRWNSHKSYMLDLAARGVPVVPTTVLPQAESSSYAFTIPYEGEVVVKPAVSSGAHRQMKADGGSAELRLQIQEMQRAGEVLVQPYLPEVAEGGEASLVYFAGEFSHAIRKRPAAGDYRVQDHHGGTIHPHKPSARELEVAVATLAAAPAQTTYGRVDIVTYHREPVVMELEVIEPELFLRYSPQGTHTFARLLQYELTV